MLELLISTLETTTLVLSVVVFFVHPKNKVYTWLLANMLAVMIIEYSLNMYRMHPLMMYIVAPSTLQQGAFHLYLLYQHSDKTRAKKTYSIISIFLLFAFALSMVFFGLWPGISSYKIIVIALAQVMILSCWVIVDYFRQKSKPLLWKEFGFVAGLFVFAPAMLVRYVFTEQFMAYYLRTGVSIGRIIGPIAASFLYLGWMASLIAIIWAYKNSKKTIANYGQANG